MRLQPVLDQFDTAYVSMFENYGSETAGQRCYVIPDASRFRMWTFVPILMRSIRILWIERPAAILTTGSAPMLPMLFLARLFGIRTLWIDSIANPETLSTSGRIAKRLATRCVAQWRPVADREGVEYWGAII